MSTPRRGRGSAADQQRRQLAIQDFVGATGSRTVEEIAEHTAVSTMTVYRDLAELETQGLLHLSKGVVTATASNRHEAASRYRATQRTAAKRRLAKAALELIEPGSAILLDDSSTGIPLAELLDDRSPLTVVTNYSPVAELVARQRHNSLILTGGQYELWAEAYFGPLAASTVRQLHVDAVFMSASAITGDTVYHPTAEPAELKREMLRSGGLKVLYADRSKFERTALHEVTPLSSFDVLIVDADTPAEFTKPALDAGVRVIVA